MPNVLEDSVACWYKARKPGTCLSAEDWKPGRLVRFAQDHLEYETGPGAIPVAIIVDDKSRGVVLTYASLVTFAAIPDGKLE